MTCAHEPEDRIHNEPTTCRHCHVEIEAITCEECAGDGHVNRYPCPACDATGREGWREAR